MKTDNRAGQPESAGAVAERRRTLVAMAEAWSDESHPLGEEF